MNYALSGIKFPKNFDLARAVLKWQGLRKDMSFNIKNKAKKSESFSSENSDFLVSKNVIETTTKSNFATNAKLQKLAKSFVALNKKKAEKREIHSWQNLVKNALNLQKGKIPLLLAVEAGNQSMCRELLSAQTAEQLKVRAVFFYLMK